MRIPLLLLAIACTPSGPAKTEAPLPDGHHRPTAQGDLGELGWRSAWSVDGRAVAPGAGEGGRLVRRDGVVQASKTASCGAHPAFEGAGLLWLPEGSDQTFTAPPMVAAPVVERASWRLGELLGPPEGIVPRGTDRDPTLHQGIRVRAVTKLRWSGPPWQVVVGERRGQVGIAIASSDASSLASGVVLHRSTSAPVEYTILTQADVDGDGKADVLVAGDGPEGSFRAVVSVLGFEGQAKLRSFEEQPSLACGGS